MQLTHTEARRLIHYDLDRILDSERQQMLFAHLQECDACRDYADGMLNTEHTLRDVMNKQWNRRPLPLSIGALKAKHLSAKSSQPLFQVRTALVSLVLVAFSFFIWQITATSVDPFGQTPSTILPAPTPSTQLSTASLASPSCEWTLYKVGELDTLERIALQYSVSIQDIMTFNDMDSQVVHKAMEIKIPLCNVTPTMTAHFPTTTLTPNLDRFIDTPG